MKSRVRAVRPAVAALLLCLVAVLAIWSSMRTAAEVARLEAAGDAFAHAGAAVEHDEGLRLRYGFVPGPELRTELYESAVKFALAMQDVQARGNPEAGAAATALSATHERYLDALGRLFAAIDADDIESARPASIESETLARELIAGGAAPAAAGYHGAAAARLASLSSPRGYLIAALVAGASGILTMIGLFIAARGSARRGETIDSLTGLGNHRAFQEQLQHCAERGQQTGPPVAIAKIDIDNFKDFNEQHGHRHGDRVLVQLAALLSAARDGSTVFRVSGDEFAIIFRGASGQAARGRVERLRLSLKGPLPGIHFSGGVAAPVAERGDAATLCAQADAALAEAKRRGNGCVVAFENIGKDAPAIVTSARAHAVRQLVAERRVAIAIQPIWGIERRGVLAYEALARPDPAYGLSGPAEAFDVAEKIGLTHELDLLCREAAVGRGAELPRDALLFVNISPQVLDRRTLSGPALLRAVAAAGLQPDRIVLEVTERHVSRLSVVVQEARALQKLGFKLALDDVGAGNSGLEMLRELPVDFLKIDREVVAGVTRHMSARAVFSAITAFARESRSLIVAEGIEDEATLDFVMSAGVDAVQGMLLGPPSQTFVTREILAAERRWFRKERSSPVPRVALPRMAG